MPAGEPPVVRDREGGDELAASMRPDDAEPGAEEEATLADEFAAIDTVLARSRRP
ncbi:MULTISPECIES: hypothetical protein [Chelativorans]|jgi:hypothetical protein|uniref:hypothetical protein n=1 Tax=Chelativorans TaxID=449972 RepID=UPI00003A36F0|nr:MULTISPECIES: hypothetical protein [Chelativorans]